MLAAIWSSVLQSHRTLKQKSSTLGQRLTISLKQPKEKQFPHCCFGRHRASARLCKTVTVRGKEKKTVRTLCVKEIFLCLSVNQQVHCLLSFGGAEMRIITSVWFAHLAYTNMSTDSWGVAGLLSVCEVLMTLKQLSACVFYSPGSTNFLSLSL